jgi:hypothetical protein
MSMSHSFGPSRCQLQPVPLFGDINLLRSTGLCVMLSQARADAPLHRFGRAAS